MGRPRKKKTRTSSLGRRKPKGPRKSTSGPPKAREAPPKRPTKRSGPKDPNQQRLQKVLAGAGYGSRRDCEQFITEGRVEVDRKVVDVLGATVDPQRQEIRVDGDVLKRFKPIYYLVNKPPGVLSTNSDPAGRMRVIDLVPEGTRLFTVGRLDKASSGLMLVTNDGELANRLAHPRYGVEKTYEVTVAGAPGAAELKNLRRGIHLAEGVVRVAGLRVKKRLKQSTQLEMVLTEGKNREIRRMAARIGHKVQRLRRIGLGTLRLGTIPPGAYRPLTPAELKRLRDLCSGKRKPKPRNSTPRKSAPRKSGPSKSTQGKSGSSAKPRAKTKTSDARTSKPTKRKTSKSEPQTTKRKTSKARPQGSKSTTTSKPKRKTKASGSKTKAKTKPFSKKKSSKPGKPKNRKSVASPKGKKQGKKPRRKSR